jgi:hypothetical protein
MLRDAFGLNLEADWVEQSVVRVLSAGYRTPDLAAPGSKPIGTTGFMEILRRNAAYPGARRTLRLGRLGQQHPKSSLRAKPGISLLSSVTGATWRRRLACHFE